MCDPIPPRPEHTSCDLVVVGAGILGLAVAREALRRQTTRGIQLRYRGRDAEHWDTLTPDSAGAARLVRLRFAA
jgi:glycine/D-amino acid oxidase-like deaminating enzyme